VQLEDFSIKGFRSLDEVGPIPVKRPTVLIGHNDAGKTATLSALKFLLGRTQLSSEDRTISGAGAGGDIERVAVTLIEGRFSCSAAEQEQLQVEALIRLRRIAEIDSAPRYEILQSVPEDVRLRTIDSLKVQDLAILASDLGVETPGDGRRRDTFLNPLREFATHSPRIDTWTTASPSIVRALPILVTFESTAQPDPESQVRSALQATYDLLLSTDSVRDTIAGLESQVTAQLASDANQLCSHIASRCPDLQEVEVTPLVSFKSGFSSVTLRASLDGEEQISLQRAGAGRKQRVTLAVWEWVSLLTGDSPTRDTVICYDEPDTHLDYARQRDFLDLIHAQCAQENVRMVLATHSLNLIDRVDIAQVVQLELVDNRTSVDQLLTDAHAEIDEFLMRITNSLGVRNSVLLNERCFLIVEGETERICMPELFRLHRGLPFQSVGIALMDCGGNEAALRVAKFLIDHGRQVYFLLDADSAIHPQTRKIFSADKLTAYGISEDARLYLGAPNELEELFSDATWVHVANENWTRTDGELWMVDDVTSWRGGGKFSSELLQNFKVNSMSGPQSKPEMMVTLVNSLNSPDDVPQQLRSHFDTVLTAASSG